MAKCLECAAAKFLLNNHVLSTLCDLWLETSAATPFQAYKHVHRKEQRHDSSFADQPYISHTTNSRGLSFKCELCNVTFVSQSDIDNHCGSGDHCDNVFLLDELHASTVATKAAELQLRADEIGSKQLQLDLQSKMYWIFLESRGQEHDVMWNDVEAMVSKYEQLERLMLLELAVWKAMCITSLSTADIIAGMKNCHDLFDWYQNGWKARKSETRNGNEISIVLKMVLPFIGLIPGHSQLP